MLPEIILFEKTEPDYKKKEKFANTIKAICAEGFGLEIAPLEPIERVIEELLKNGDYDIPVIAYRNNEKFYGVIYVVAEENGNEVILKDVRGLLKPFDENVINFIRQFQPKPA